MTEASTVDIAWMRPLMSVIIILGCIFFQSSRQKDVNGFVVTTTFNRFVIVPPVVYLVYMLGGNFNVYLAFGIIDPLFAFLTQLVWAREPAVLKSGNSIAEYYAQNNS